MKFIPKYQSPKYLPVEVNKQGSQLDDLSQINSQIEQIANRDHGIKSSIEQLKYKLKIGPCPQDFDVSYSSISMAQLCGSCNVLRRRLDSMKNMANPLKEEMKIMALENAKLTRQNTNLRQKMIQLEREQSQTQKQLSNDMDKDSKLLVQYKLKDMECSALLKQNNSLIITVQKLKYQLQQVRNQLQSTKELKHNISTKQTSQLQSTLSRYLQMIKEKDEEFQKEKIRFQNHLQKQQEEFRRVHNSHVRLQDELKKQIQQKQTVIELINKSINSNELSHNRNANSNNDTSQVNLNSERMRLKQLETQKVKSMNIQLLEDINVMRNENMYLKQMIANFQFQMAQQSQLIQDYQLKIHQQNSKEKSQIMQQFQLLKQQLTHSHQIQDNYIAKISQFQTLKQNQINQYNKISTINQQLRKDFQAIQHQRSNILNDNAFFKQQIDQLYGQVKNLQHEKQLSQRENVKLTNKINDLNLQINEKHSSNQNLQLKLKLVSDAFAKTQTQYQEKLFSAQKELQSRKNHIIGLNSTLQSLKKEFGEQKLSLAHQLSNIQRELELLRIQQVNTKKSKQNITKLTTELKLSTQSLVQKQKQLQSVTNKLQSVQIAHHFLQDQKRQLTSSLLEQKQNNKQLIKEVSSTRDELIKLEQQKRVFEHQKQVYQTQIQLLKSSLKSSSESHQLSLQYNNKLQKMSQQMVAVNKKCMFIEGINESLKKQIEEKSQEINQANISIDQLINMKNELSACLKNKQLESTDFINRIHELQGQMISTKEEWTRDKQMMISQNQQEVETKQTLIDDKNRLSQEIKALTLTHNELKQDITSIRKIVNHLTQQNNELNHQLSSKDKLINQFSLERQHILNDSNLKQQQLIILKKQKTQDQARIDQITLKLSSTHQKLSLNQTQLSSTVFKLRQIQAKLQQTHKAYTQTTNKLTIIQNSLVQTQTTLSQTQNALSSTKNQLAFCQNQLTSTLTKLSQAEIQFNQKYLQLKVKAQALQQEIIRMKSQANQQLNDQDLKRPDQSKKVNTPTQHSQKHQTIQKSNPGIQVQQLARTCEQQSFKILSLQQQLNEWQICYNHEVQNRQMKEKQLQSLQQQVQICQKEKLTIISKSNQFIQKLQGQLGQTNRKILAQRQQLHRQIQHFEQNVLNAFEETRRISEEKDLLTNQVNVLNQDNINLFEDNKKLYQENIRLTDQITALHQQVETVQYQLAQSRSHNNSPVKQIPLPVSRTTSQIELKYQNQLSTSQTMIKQLNTSQTMMRQLNTSQTMIKRSSEQKLREKEEHITRTASRTALLANQIQNLTEQNQQQLCQIISLKQQLSDLKLQIKKIKQQQSSNGQNQNLNTSQAYLNHKSYVQLQQQLNKLKQQQIKAINQTAKHKQQAERLISVNNYFQQEIQVMNQMFTHLVEQNNSLKVQIQNISKPQTLSKPLSQSKELSQQKAQTQSKPFTQLKLLKQSNCKMIENNTDKIRYDQTKNQNIPQEQQKIDYINQKHQIIDQQPSTKQQQNQQQSLELIASQLSFKQQFLLQQQVFLKQKQHLIQQKQLSMATKRELLLQLQNRLRLKLLQIQQRTSQLTQRQLRFKDNQTCIEQTLVNAKKMLQLIDWKSNKIQKIKQKKKKLTQINQASKIISNQLPIQSHSQQSQHKQTTGQKVVFQKQTISKQQQQCLNEPAQLIQQQPQPQNEQQDKLRQDFTSLQSRISQFLKTSREQRQTRRHQLKKIQLQAMGQSQNDNKELMELIVSLRQPNIKLSSTEAQLGQNELLYFAQIESFTMRKYEQLQQSASQSVKQSVLLLSQILQSTKLLFSTKSQPGLKQLTSDIKQAIQKLLQTIFSTYSHLSVQIPVQGLNFDQIQSNNYQLNQLNTNQLMQFKKKKYPSTANKPKQPYSELYSDRKPTEVIDFHDDFHQSETLSQQPDDFIDDDVDLSKNKQRSILLIEDIGEAVSVDDDDQPTNAQHNLSFRQYSLQANSRKGSEHNNNSILTSSKQFQSSFDFNIKQQTPQSPQQKALTQGPGLLLSELSSMSRRQMEDRYKNNIKNTKLASKLKGKRRR